MVDKGKEQVSAFVDKSKEQVSEYVDRGREVIDRGRAQWEEFVERGKNLVADQTNRVSCGRGCWPSGVQSRSTNEPKLTSSEGRPFDPDRMIRPRLLHSLPELDARAIEMGSRAGSGENAAFSARGASSIGLVARPQSPCARCITMPSSTIRPFSSS